MARRRTRSAAAPAPKLNGRRRLATLAAICVSGGATVLIDNNHIHQPAPIVVATVALPPAVVGLGYLEPSSTILKIGASGSPDAARIATLDTAAKLAVQVDAWSAQVQLKRLMLERQKLDIAYTIETRRSALVRARAPTSSGHRPTSFANSRC